MRSPWGPLGVALDTTMTMTSGVVVKLAAGQRADVAGALAADGVVFTSLDDDTMLGDTNGDGAATSPAPGDWGWLSLAADGSVLSGARFSYGGSGAPYHGTVELNDGVVATITGCTFSHNAGGTLADRRAAALNAAEAAAATTITDNVFFANEVPLVIGANVSIDASNVFHDTDGTSNAFDGIFLDNVFYGLDGAVTWSNTEVPYVVIGSTLSIADTATLTLADGVIIKLDGGSIGISGSLVQGADNWFTSLMDDTLLGDTNGDADLTSPTANDWAGVNLCPPGDTCSWATWANILYAQHS